MEDGMRHNHLLLNLHIILLSFSASPLLLAVVPSLPYSRLRLKRPPTLSTSPTPPHSAPAFALLAPAP